MAQTNKGRKFYVCETAKPTDLNQTEYEALTWVEVGNVGSVGETGTATNIVSYDELSTDVTQKQKGISNAGDPVVEVARNPTDVGQIAITAMAVTKLFYAFKTEDDDAPTAGDTNTIYYDRGVVTGPTRPGGRNEDFILENYTLGLVQTQITVAPVSASVPVVVLLPAISGVAQDGEVLTAYVGTWTNSPTSYTYQWQNDGGTSTWADISAETASTYTLAAADIGDSVRVVVTAVNGAGSSSAANSVGTDTVIA